MKKQLLAGLFGLMIASTASAFDCADKGKYCKDMSSCEEARFYLEKCGATRLDRDGDGIPCENVCGKGKKSKKGKKTSSKLFEKKEEQTANTLVIENER